MNEQVVNLHYILSKARVASRPSVLWCYKKEVRSCRAMMYSLPPSSDIPVRPCAPLETVRVR